MYRLALASVLCLGLATTAAAQTAPPDVVELHDGSYMRGTIVERAEGQYVVIQLLTGEIRKLEDANVLFAGPSSDWPRNPTSPRQADTLDAPEAPPPAAAPAPPSDGKINVNVTGDGRALTLHHHTGTGTGGVSTSNGYATVRVDTFSPICTAPCATRLERQSHAFGVSLDKRDPVPVKDGLLTLDQPSTLLLDYQDQTGIRTAGWLIAIGSIIAGSAIMMAPLLGSGSIDGSLALIATGGIVMTLGSVIGLLMIYTKDSASVRIQPN